MRGLCIPYLDFRWVHHTRKLHISKIDMHGMQDYIILSYWLFLFTPGITKHHNQTSGYAMFKGPYNVAAKFERPQK